MKKKLLMSILFSAMLLFSGCEISEPTGNLPSSEGNSQCTHTELKTLPETEATCSQTGLTEGKECVDCGEIVQEQQVIEIKEHTFDDENDKLCNTCGFLNSEVPTFVVSEINAVAGNDNVAVTISLRNNPGIASIVLSLNYDDTHLSLTEVEYNSTIGGQTVCPQVLRNPVTLYWINGFSNAIGDWFFVTLHFDISDHAMGEYDIQISYEVDNVYNIDEINLPFDVVQGKIIIQ